MPGQNQDQKRRQRRFEKLGLKVFRGYALLYELKEAKEPRHFAA